MAEETDTGILREIDEELRQEHYSLLWKRYGNFIIAAAILLVASVAGYKGWQSYDISARTTAAEQFNSALKLSESGEAAQAHDAFTAIAADSTAGYQLLARLRAASELGAQGDRAGASAAFDTIAADSKLEATYRDLAALLSIANAMDSMDMSAARERLSALSKDNNPWRYSARELGAVAAIRSGDIDGATTTLNELSTDASAPASIRSRAQEMLSALGSS